MPPRYDIYEIKTGSWVIYDRFIVDRVPGEFPTSDAAMEWLKQQTPARDVVEVTECKNQSKAGCDWPHCECGAATFPWSEQ